MKKFLQKASLAAGSLLFALSLTAVLPAGVTAQSNSVEQNLCAGANLDVGNTDCDASGAQTTVNSILKTVIDIFSLVVGVVSVIMIIIGGLKYITSGGDSGNVSGAKNTILYAIVGLVIVALAQLIVRFVLSEVSDATI